ncbi:MAG: ribokinase [Pseudonocardiaceae bacterium]
MVSDVIVVGSANVDVVVPVQRRPGPGETVLGGDTTTGPGGKGANTAVAAARLGARVAMLGAVGRDAHGDQLLDSLRAAGVDTRLIRRAAHPTGAAYITVTPDGENAIVVSPGANAQVGVDDVAEARAVIGAAGVLFAVLEVPLPTVRRAVACAAAAGVRVVLNASPVATLDPGTLAAADPLIVNQHEAAWLLGHAWANPDAHDPAEMATGLLARGTRSVVVTLGADGAVVADPDGAVRVPAPEVSAVDTTGAGDAFAGALACRLAGASSLVDAARYAVRVAAISVTRTGAQSSYPSAAEVDRA